MGAWMCDGTDAAARFRALHQRAGLFVMPNPWDAGTARLLADLGFEAIATSSAALAWTLAKADATGGVTRDDAIAHAKLLARRAGFRSTAISRAAMAIRRRRSARRSAGRSTPASPAARSRTRIRQRRTLSARRGAPPLLRGEGGGGEVRLGLRADRALRGLPRSNFRGDPLGEAVRRLKAYEAAGADVVYAPGVTTEAEVARHRRGGEGAGQRDRRPRRHLERHPGAGEARREARLDRLRACQGRARRVPEGGAGARRPPGRLRGRRAVEHAERRLRPPAAMRRRDD